VFDVTDKNNISFESLDIHYHHNYQIRCYANNNVCLYLHNCHCSIFLATFNLPGIKVVIQILLSCWYQEIKDKQVLMCTGRHLNNNNYLLLLFNCEQFFSYFMVRTIYISMKWCPLRTRPTWLVEFLSASILKQQSVGRHVIPLWHISWFCTTSLRSCS